MLSWHGNGVLGFGKLWERNEEEVEGKVDTYTTQVLTRQ
jgi:hypothetical protein